MQHRPATKQESAEITQLLNELTDLLKGHPNKMVLFTLSRLLPLYWCGIVSLTTVTEALDAWRELNEQMEDTIRKNFGYIRYHDKAKR
jgi:hypothetical protein